MKLSSPTSLLLNLGHAMDHWVLAIFLYTVSVIAGVWGADWKELTPYAFGASFMFGAGSIVSGKLGDQWGRRAMMVLFFAGMGVSSLVIALCQNKWQIGPGGVFGYLGGKWLAGVFPQQWFSVGGPGPQTTSQMNVQYFFVYLPGHGWGIGTSPNMLVNWYANKNGNMVTFPVGLQISKVIKVGPLPVKFAVQGQYMPVHPDVFGQKWNLQFAMTPVIPKLIKGNLFGD